MQGGAPCRFTFSPQLQPEVTSGRAMFGNVAPVELERMKNGSLLGTIPGLQTIPVTCLLYLLPFFA